MQYSANGPTSSQGGILALTVFLLSAQVPVSALAQETRIESVTVASETRDSVTLDVIYTYGGEHGGEVFMSARMARNGKVSDYYAYRPGRVSRGRHRARVFLGTNERAPDVFTTNQVEVRMYAGGEAFLDRSFGFAKTWTRPGGSLRPVLTVVGQVKPMAGTLSLARPEAGQGSTPGGGTGAPVRRVLPNGRVQLRYPDGTVRERYRGGETVTRPDGTTQTMSYASAQPPTPPSAPPDAMHADWLESQNTRLLGIIRTLVGNDELSVQHYLAQEGDGASPYERIESRTRTVGMLVRP